MSEEGGVKDIDQDLARVFNNIEQRRKEYISSLREAVAIRSVSQWPDARSELLRMVQWTADKLIGLGAKVELRKIGEELSCSEDDSSAALVPLPPVLFASLGTDETKKTVLVYGHLDVAPVDENEGWESDPWALVEFDGKLIGRGATDDKGPVLGWIHAVEAYKNTGVPLPVNIKFIFESMQECKSHGLDSLLHDHSSEKFLSDVACVCISDNYWISRHKPCLTYGLRGLCYFFVEIESGKKDLHSGVFGGAVREAMSDLMYLLNSLTDADGNILIPNLMEEVIPLDPKEEEMYGAIDFDTAEFLADSGAYELRHAADKGKVLMSRWRFPSLSIHGVQGCFSEPGAKAVIPRKVIGKFSIRIVPNQTIKHVVKCVTEFVFKKWTQRGSTNKMKVYPADDGCPFWLSDPKHPNYEAASRAISTVYNITPDLTREGGFVPAVLILQEVTNKNVLLLPMGAADDSAHYHNEKLDIRNYIEGTKVMAAYLMEVGKSKEDFK